VKLAQHRDEYHLAVRHEPKTFACWVYRSALLEKRSSWSELSQSFPEIHLAAGGEKVRSSLSSSARDPWGRISNSSGSGNLVGYCIVNANWPYFDDVLFVNFTRMTRQKMPPISMSYDAGEFVIHLQWDVLLVHSCHNRCRLGHVDSHH